MTTVPRALIALKAPDEHVNGNKRSLVDPACRRK